MSSRSRCFFPFSGTTVLTGMLDLTDEGTHRRIYVIEGNLSFMQSNAEGENVVRSVLRRGRVTDPTFSAALAYMKERIERSSSRCSSFVL